MRLDAALHGDDDDPPVLGKALHVAADVVAGDHVEDDVDAGAVGEAQRFGDEVLRLVVDRVVGAEGAACGCLLAPSRPW